LTPVLSRPQYSFAPPPYLPPGCGSSLIDLFAHRTSPPSSRPARASLAPAEEEKKEEEEEEEIDMVRFESRALLLVIDSIQPCFGRVRVWLVMVLWSCSAFM